MLNIFGEINRSLPIIQILLGDFGSQQDQTGRTFRVRPFLRLQSNLTWQKGSVARRSAYGLRTNKKAKKPGPH